VAEQTGAIAEIDTWVLETACAAAAAWARPHGVSIKLSPHWFCFGNITAMVAAVLGRTGLAADRLVLEITERTVIDHPDEARLRIAELRELGVRVALDDFGIGYSALGSLKAYSFDKLKLDRSFIQDLETDAKARDVARAVLALGRALRMTVCAEGVETPYQLAFLKAENCGFAQGFLLARPSAIPVERDYSSSASPSASLHQRNAELAAGTPA
jgi:EAL domain-containing protein (putative c-di-GMP-specific phosphodiesterase class I)